MGRTTNQYLRVYADGRDLSGDASSIGPLTWKFDDEAKGALSWGVKGTLPGQCTILAGTLNGIFNNATGGIHDLAAGEGVNRAMMVDFGMNAAPAIGDPAFVGKFIQGAYQATPGGNMLTVTVPFHAPDPASIVYPLPWGVMLMPKSSKSAAYTGAGVNNGAATALGGFMAFQIFSISGGSVTLSVDDSADGVTWAAVTGLSSGSIAAASIPCGGIVNLSTTATIRQYARAQLALAGGATAVEFAMALVRGR